MILRELTAQDEQAFLDGASEWPVDQLGWYTFDWKLGESYAGLLEKLRKNAAGDVAPQFVPSSMLYAFNDDGQIVGRLSIRHTLNEKLRERGGHLGYAVAPKFRMQGYATEIMRQGLAFCRKLGINEIMLTCADANIPSWKIIETFGGVLADKIYDDVDKEMIRRYWIKA